MNYKLIKKIHKSVFIVSFIFLGLVSCYDSGFEEYVAPTGNINDIQPSTLFTSTTSADDNLAIVFRSYSTDAASYLWDFGDGNTSIEPNPDYTYVTGGLYKVKLTTISSDGLMAVDSSNVAPVFVDFNIAKIDSQVTFENLSSGAASLVWDFGDAASVEWTSDDTILDADYNPVHVYKTADTFVATLTATNFLGAKVSVSKNIEGLVLSTVPDFTFTTNSLTADFTDTSVLAVTHSWDFGDGTTSTDVNPSHTYAALGAYDVTLTTTNNAGVSRSITKAVPVGGLKPTFKAIVLNGTADDHLTGSTSDNSDSWDMTPNSTVVDDVLGVIDSPYRAIWYNKDLNDYIDATYCTDEQPGSSSDGNYDYVNDKKSRGVKLYSVCRRLYQVVTVEPGVEYSFTIDSRSEAEGVTTDVFILNTEITTEADIDADVNHASVDKYFEITNDFNSSKPSSSEKTFTTNTFTFKASANKVVIYVRALKAVDGSNEVFFDNIDIITPGF
jgi:PKD repeat protein